MIVHADELEREIAAEREALGENLAELEHQAKELVDWRSHVRKAPLAMMSVAFGGGLLVAAMAGPRKPRSAARMVRERDVNGDDEPSAARDAWEIFKGALFAAAAAEVTSYVAELLPDFREHLDEHRQERAARKRKLHPRAATNGDSDAGSDS